MLSRISLVRALAPFVQVPLHDLSNHLPKTIPSNTIILGFRFQHMSLDGDKNNLSLAAYESESEVAQSCPTLCDPMNSSTPGLPVYHQLPEFTQTHVHGVSDAIQPVSIWTDISILYMK